MSRLWPASRKDVMAATLRKFQDGAPFNLGVHEDNHGVRIWIYTSTATLTTDAGTELYAPFGGELAWVSASVAGAPVSTALKVDILVDGNSVFSSGNYLEIPATQKFGYRTPVEHLGILPIYSANPTPIKVQINTISSATGPLLVYFGISTTEV